jgi:Leucine-rich repeat (LRR) protein
MKDNFLLLFGVPLCLIHIGNQKVFATSAELFKNEEFIESWSLPKSGSFSMDLAEHSDIEAKLTELNACPNIICDLDVSDNFLDNCALRLISAFGELRKLNLANNVFDDDGLRSLEPLSKITDLNLYHTKITATGIPKLSSLKELAILDVSCTLMGTSGIIAIQKIFPRLHTLYVRGCTLEDQSLEHILTMPNLKKVDISSNRSLSSSAVQEFRKKSLEKGLVVISG